MTLKIILVKHQNKYTRVLTFIRDNAMYSRYYICD